MPSSNRLEAGNNEKKDESRKLKFELILIWKLIAPGSTCASEAGLNLLNATRTPPSLTFLLFFFLKRNFLPFKDEEDFYSRQIKKRSWGGTECLWRK